MRGLDGPGLLFLNLFPESRVKSRVLFHRRLFAGTSYEAVLFMFKTKCLHTHLAILIVTNPVSVRAETEGLVLEANSIACCFDRQ